MKTGLSQRQKRAHGQWSLEACKVFKYVSNSLRSYLFAVTVIDHY